MAAIEPDALVDDAPVHAARKIANPAYDECRPTTQSGTVRVVLVPATSDPMQLDCIRRHLCCPSTTLNGSVSNKHSEYRRYSPDFEQITIQ
jgi:hypothetical protein